MNRRLGLAVHVGAAVAAVLITAGCTGGAPPSPANAGSSALVSAPPSGTGPAATAAATPPLTPAPSSATAPPTAGSEPSPTQAASPAPIPATPPVAVLGGLDGPAASGQLGSYTWGSGGSDAPWIVGEALGTATSGASLDVSLAGATPASWTAAWAEVSGGIAGSPSAGASGSGQVAVTAPAKAGDWTLRVTATFGPGHNATYFWHLAIK